MAEIYHDRRMYGIDLVRYGDPKDADVWLPPDMIDCVVFLSVQHNGRFFFGGTAFFLGVPSETEDGTTYHYLVTAKHNIEKAARMGQLHVRINRRDGGSDNIAIGEEWTFSEDEASDVAVLSFCPDTTIYEYKVPIAGDFCATDELLKEKKVGIGEDLVAVGLFTERHGTKRNAPIVRVGHIASMPGEPLTDDSGLEYRAYLAELHSIGGLSGSPVFVYLGPGSVEKGMRWGRQFILLGLVRSHWDYKPGRNELDFGNEELRAVNMGIATVTPIQEVMRILNGEEWMKQRRKEEADRRKEHAPTLDSAFPSEPASSQTTAQGYEIPVPTKAKVLGDMARASRKKK